MAMDNLATIAQDLEFLLYAVHHCYDGLSHTGCVKLLHRLAERHEINNLLEIMEIGGQDDVYFLATMALQARVPIRLAVLDGRKRILATKLALLNSQVALQRQQLSTPLSLQADQGRDVGFLSSVSTKVKVLLLEPGQQFGDRPWIDPFQKMVFTKEENRMQESHTSMRHLFTNAAISQIPDLVLPYTLVSTSDNTDIMAKLTATRKAALAHLRESAKFNWDAKQIFVQIKGSSHPSREEHSTREEQQETGVTKRMHQFLAGGTKNYGVLNWLCTLLTDFASNKYVSGPFLDLMMGRDGPLVPTFDNLMEKSPTAANWLTVLKIRNVVACRLWEFQKNKGSKGATKWRKQILRLRLSHEALLLWPQRNAQVKDPPLNLKGVDKIVDQLLQLARQKQGLQFHPSFQEFLETEEPDYSTIPDLVFELPNASVLQEWRLHHLITLVTDSTSTDPARHNLIQGLRTLKESSNPAPLPPPSPPNSTTNVAQNPPPDNTLTPEDHHLRPEGDSSEQWLPEDLRGHPGGTGIQSTNSDSEEESLGTARSKPDVSEKQQAFLEKQLSGVRKERDELKQKLVKLQELLKDQLYRFGLDREQLKHDTDLDKLEQWLRDQLFQFRQDREQLKQKAEVLQRAHKEDERRVQQLKIEVIRNQKTAQTMEEQREKVEALLETAHVSKQKAEAECSHLRKRNAELATEIKKLNQALEGRGERVRATPTNSSDNEVSNNPGASSNDSSDNVWGEYDQVQAENALKALPKIKTRVHPTKGTTKRATIPSIQRPRTTENSGNQHNLQDRPILPDKVEHFESCIFNVTQESRPPKKRKQNEAQSNPNSQGERPSKKNATIPTPLKNRGTNRSPPHSTAQRMLHQAKFKKTKPW